MKRRDLIIRLSGAAAGSGVLAASEVQPGCPADGTPAQFVPKKAADPSPHADDIRKYPKCPYCGMDRAQFHHSRVLIHYSDDLPDAVCSLHCAAISLSLNIDRDPKAIWVGDNASVAEVKPLVAADKAAFLVGSETRGVMTARSKVAFGDSAAAKKAQASGGGEVVTFDQALLAAYTDMARDVAMIRKNRQERRRRAMPGK
jgi:nitrous oxide reductase accessory protein NosL